MKPFAIADNFIVIMALRYALGRLTGAPAHVRTARNGASVGRINNRDLFE